MCQESLQQMMTGARLHYVYMNREKSVGKSILLVLYIDHLVLGNHSGKWRVYKWH